MSEKVRLIILITVLSLILIIAFLTSYYNSMVIRLFRFSSNTEGVSTSLSQTTSITLEERSYYAKLIEPNDYLGKNIILRDVVFIPLPVTTTGCRGNWFLVLYPDGDSEVIQIFYACTGTPEQSKRYIALGNHECPKAGIMYYNGNFYLLVSKDCVRTARKIVVKYIGDWIIMLLVPSNTSLTNPKLLYKLIYIGESFSAASSTLPPTWCKVLIKDPGGHKVYLLERGLCPWIRDNNTYIMPGYTYSYWLDLNGVVSVPGKYHIEALVSCIFKKINYVKNTIETIKVNATLAMDLSLR